MPKTKNGVGWEPKTVAGLGGNERAVELEDGTIVRVRLTRSETETQLSLKACATRIDKNGNPLDYRGKKASDLPQECAEVRGVMKDWLAGGDPQAKLDQVKADLTDRIIEKFAGHKAAAALWDAIPEEPDPEPEPGAE